jgi:demethylmenaquinone methyltransferase/2-methoxy-6-polyprenyl-1,4-benzoquinol methylase
LADKAEYVRDMFASVASRYDLLNSILSFRRHKVWRRVAVHDVNLHPGDIALDVCTGTGDFALDLRNAVGEAGRVAGIDFCLPMLEIGVRKISQKRHANMCMILGDALRLPFADNSFDCVTVGFGIRNVSDIRMAFQEMARVAKPGGRVACLEFTPPKSGFWKPFILLYERRILPMIGGALSDPEAYTYLPNSISAFETPQQLAEIMGSAGLKNITVKGMNFGSVCLHIGIKS